MKRLAILALAAVMLLGINSASFASDSKSYDVKAYVPQLNGLSISISKIPVSGGPWQPGQSSVDFGTLSFDSTYKIFRANYYYAVDVGINSNTSDWTVTHTPYSVTLVNGTETLDNHINVSFVKQINDTTDQPLSKVSFANSNKSFTKSQLLGGWLRIYYGIATGSGDNPGVTPIPSTKTFGQYKGSVTITLTP
ncbi:MAG: hypothetical protein NC900_05700 [Candidatus Omnitrophica bacterium]|nr:hypothetical protein [Candidatus Omnitrophota bacterium]